MTTLAEQLGLVCPACGSMSIAAEVETWFNFDGGYPHGFDTHDTDDVAAKSDGVRICRDCDHEWTPVVGAAGLRLRKVCSSCGSEDVRVDAWVTWSEARQAWEVAEVFDAAFCAQCDGETSIVDQEVVEPVATSPYLNRPTLSVNERRLVDALQRIANHEFRADRRRRGMVDASEVEDLRRIARNAVRELTGAPDYAPAAELTDQGAQTILPGAEKRDYRR